MIVTIDIPPSVYERAADMAQRRNSTVGEILLTAVTEHVDAWDRLQYRALRGDRSKFLEVLAKVPDTKPCPEDRL